MSARSESDQARRRFLRTPGAARVVDAFLRRFGRAPEVVVRAPGRVALLGAHVDYNDGWVLPAAIDRAVWLAASRADAQRARLVALDVGSEGDEVILEPAALPAPVPERGNGETTWADYPAGILRVLGKRVPAGFDAVGFDAVFGGDLPQGAGVSSSAAVEVAFLLALREILDLDLSRVEMAALGRRAENEYLGVGSGIMDQFASLHGAEGQAVLLDCRTLEHERVPLPPSVRILVFDSGVRRRLVGSGFDDRRSECRRAVEILRGPLPGLRALRDLSADELACHRDLLPKVLERRVRHVVEECARVLEGAAALRADDARTFGALMTRSHASSRDLYEVSIPEIDTICAAASASPRCLGARLMGGGFGGCVAALVETDLVDQSKDAAALDEVVGAVHDAWRTRFDAPPPVAFATRAAAGAEVVRVTGSDGR